MNIRHATDQREWDDFLKVQRFSPFLQSWTMGDVYADLKQTPIRLIAEDASGIQGICQALVVPARRGRHLSVPYGPVIAHQDALPVLLNALQQEASREGCSFIRLSPHIPKDATPSSLVSTRPSPLHLLAEHLWYLPLTDVDAWSTDGGRHSPARSPDELMKQMRATTRNLIRRAEKEGVTIRASNNPVDDLHLFLRLHDETRKRHGFTPYSDSFFRAQVRHFAPRNECTLYLADYQGEVISASIHMHVSGETSYHHGASTVAHRKIPSSYLLQWTAIQDALKRGDHVYNFWGIAPQKQKSQEGPQASEEKTFDAKHPFAGVTLFKTGFGGKILELMHCIDIPLKPSYHITRSFEVLRKWKRGF